MALSRPCLGPAPGQPCPYGNVTTTTRCRACTTAYEAGRRGTTTQRGYGWEHQQVRSSLAGTLPCPCGYCGVTVERAEPWVAAHVRDGQPEYGWMVAHPVCNERAKVRPRGG